MGLFRWQEVDPGLTLGQFILHTGYHGGLQLPTVRLEQIHTTHHMEICREALGPEGSSSLSSEQPSIDSTETHTTLLARNRMPLNACSRGPWKDKNASLFPSCF
ncbi:unnamed protein product [Pleuronectes platessa]|uniref:Uncharacterized protein n=1 Tax=Pleuronectes platessa TaxID=8262 RepID=A0A9N7TV13_PLEPL|nr:unnamed protein product [Pleuronectes platessa]